MKRKFLPLGISVVVGGMGLFGLLLSVPSSSAGAMSSTPSCKAAAHTPECFFNPSGTAISYVARVPSGAFAEIAEWNHTCSVETSNVLQLSSGSGTFNIAAGDCVVLSVLGHARVEASG